jgi:hypothetical protein
LNGRPNERPTRDANDRSDEMTKAKRSTLSPKAPRKSAGNMAQVARKSKPKKTPVAIPRLKTRQPVKLKRPLVRSNEIKYPVRRFLAERTGVDGKQEYLVDWYPAWQPAAHLKDQALQKKEWEANKEKHTFKMGNTTVIKCANPTEDDSPRQTRLMLDAVLNATKKWFGRPKMILANELFSEADWVFARGIDEEEAARRAGDMGKGPRTAAQVMAETYLAMHESPEESIDHMNLIYGDIQVRFLGQIDKLLGNANLMRRKRGRVVGFLRSLFEPILRDMVPKEWKTNQDKHDKLKQLKEVADAITTKSTFLLKHPWPLFFVRLFFMSDDLHKRLENKKVMLQPIMKDDWHSRTRDLFLHTYIQAFKWEQRPVDCVERTYLECRDRVTWHTRFRSVKDDPDAAKDEEDEPVEESDEDDDEAEDDNDEDDDEDENYDYAKAEGVVADDEDIELDDAPEGGQYESVVAEERMEAVDELQEVM